MRPSAIGFMLILALGLLWTPLVADAQQSGKIPRIGWLALDPPLERILITTRSYKVCATSAMSKAGASPLSSAGRSGSSIDFLPSPQSWSSFQWRSS